MNTYDIRNKEVINIYDGRSLGFVEDVELNLEKGTYRQSGALWGFSRGEKIWSSAGGISSGSATT